MDAILYDKIGKEAQRLSEYLLGTYPQETLTDQAVASFNDGADDIPIKQMVVAVDPVQDLHGYNHPWPGGGGKNVLPLTLADLKSQNTEGTWTGNTYARTNGTYTVNEVGGSVSSIVLKSTSGDGGIMSLSFTLKAGTYIMSSGFNESYGLTDTFLTKGGTTIARGNANSPGQTFTLSEDSEVMWNIRANGEQNITAYPMIRLATETDPSFAPYSNICPISGWTGAKIGESGKNLLDNNNASSINGVISTSPHKIEANENAKTVYIPCKGNTEYVISKTKGNRFVVACTEELPAVGVTTSQEEVINTSATSYAITTGARAKYLCVYCYLSTADTLTLQEILDSMQIEFGSTATIREPFVANKQYPIAFPIAAGTVFGAYIDAYQDGAGSLMVKNGEVDLGDLSWTYDSTNVNFYASVPSLPKDSGVRKTWCICSMYKTLYNSESYDVNWDNVAYFNNNLLRIHDKEYTDATTFTTAVTGQKLVYELATPVTYTLAAPQVKTLLGVNNIWADAGNIKELVYRADLGKYLIGNLAANILNANS